MTTVYIIWNFLGLKLEGFDSKFMLLLSELEWHIFWLVVWLVFHD